MSVSVAIVAPGNMGSAVGRRLIANGVSVLTALEGRSTASAARAAAAGFIIVPSDQLVEADFLLSILPPAAALSFAESMRGLLANASRKPVFVDCNAVNPQTVQQIAAVIASTGTLFVDVGIIGLPPVGDQPGPRFYASGDHARKLEVLARHGVEIRVLEGPIGAASALKMTYAGINKGVTAIGAAMILAATRAGATDALRQELAESQPALLASLTRAVPDMLPKSYRWVAEMQEIAAFAGEDEATRDLFLAISQLYERLSHESRDGGAEADALLKFFA